MTSETTERKPQRKLKWDACDRWMVGQGCEVGYLGIGIALRDRAPLYVALPGGKRHVFGLEGSAWRPHDFRLAVAWVALQLNIPVPWRTDDAPPTEDEGKWSENIFSDSMDEARCGEVAQLLGGTVNVKVTQANRFGVWRYRTASGHPRPADHSLYAFRMALTGLAKYLCRFRADRIWLGPLPMPPDAPQAQDEGPGAEGECKHEFAYYSLREASQWCPECGEYDCWPVEPPEPPPTQSEVPGAEGEGAAERFACRHHILRRVVGGAGVWTCKYCAARFAIANLST